MPHLRPGIPPSLALLSGVGASNPGSGSVARFMALQLHTRPTAEKVVWPPSSRPLAQGYHQQAPAAR